MVQKRPLLSRAARLYVDALWSLPLVLVLFWFYLLMPLFLRRPVSGFASACIALTAFEAAYFSEIIRSGLLAIPPGQLDAALALGFRRVAAWVQVLIPQAVRAMVPVLLAQGLIPFQDTTLVYIWACATS